MSRKQKPVTGPTRPAMTEETSAVLLDPRTWAYVLTRTEAHVYPMNDLRRHSIRDCWCLPVDDDGVIVHHSLDGREQYERGERKLS